MTDKSSESYSTKFSLFWLYTKAYKREMIPFLRTSSKPKKDSKEYREEN